MKLTLKAARANANISQEEIAKMLNVSKSTVSRWETGVLPIPHRKLVAFCEVCKQNESDIFVRKGE